ncbi:hypothetical protein EVAR_13078_1 [Eumeta japonica]|uniref:Uncharacterized protein n=1 Tax=Eumeta variegata TaxID=151549 RepID=A0A4C2A3X8_EUMVA|nr:hypothetical protein EVAR_13078_1 [Eumeta japonica]
MHSHSLFILDRAAPGLEPPTPARCGAGGAGRQHPPSSPLRRRRPRHAACGNSLVSSPAVRNRTRHPLSPRRRSRSLDTTAVLVKLHQQMSLENGYFFLSNILSLKISIVQPRTSHYRRWRVNLPHVLSRARYLGARRPRVLDRRAVREGWGWAESKLNRPTGVGLVYCGLVRRRSAADILYRCPREIAEGVDSCIVETKKRFG